MASSLTADSFYNLSTQHQNNYNKELIYVKLTDSALRAIEEFVKNQSKYGSSKPSIQFTGNEGFLSFPSIGNNNGSSQQIEQKFSFQLDSEETQGLYECIQQTSGLMDVLGPIQYKMRVQAQEDVYDATRRSMALAAEKQKNKCTREIKPNQQDIGRKVITKKATSSIIPSSYNRTTTNNVPTPNNNNSSNSSNITSISNSLKRSLEVANDNGNTNSMSHFTSQQQIPAINSHNSYSNSQDHHDSLYHHQSNHHHNNTINPLNGVVGDDIDHQRMPLNMGHNLNRNNQQNHRYPDIMKKPIKERLIHLLALRPFKKPELYDRLNREGIKDRDRSVILNVLKSISFVRDNAYVLHRHVWNDVHEDWPFYTDQDRATLKRRKPQNLTPPLSSDGGSSSTSGQSPNSQHNGSPPPLVKRPSSQSTSSMNNNMNSNLMNDKYMEPVAKKQRISHYKKNPHEIDSSSSIRLVGSYDNSRDGSSFMNSRSRDNDDYFGSNTTPISLDDNSSIGLNFTVLTSEGISKMNSNRGQSKNNSNQERSQRNGNRTNGTTLKTTTTQSSSYDKNPIHTIRTTSNGDIEIDGLRENKNVPSKNSFSDYPPITNIEQRRKYKTEFDKDYAEYRTLHAVMEKARNRFASLQNELRKVDPTDERKYKEIQNQIIQEYKENNNDSSFQDKKQRFDYLHEKLSHIKKLVSDFDMELTKGSTGNNMRENENLLGPSSYSNSPQKNTSNINGNTQSMHTAY